MVRGKAASRGEIFDRRGQEDIRQATWDVLRQYMLQGTARDVQEKGLVWIFGNSSVDCPQTKVVVHDPILLSGNRLCPVESMSGPHPPCRIAQVGQGGRAQTRNANCIRDRKHLSGIRFDPVHIGFPKALDNSRIEHIPLLLPALERQRGGLRQHLDQRHRGRFQSDRQVTDAQLAIVHPEPRLFGTVDRYEACHGLGLTHINANKQCRRLQSRLLAYRMGMNPSAIRQGNRSTSLDGHGHLVISRDVPSSCATASVSTAPSEEAGNSCVSFPTGSQPYSLNQFGTLGLSREAEGISSSRRLDQVRHHGPGLALQGIYFHMKLDEERTLVRARSRPWDSPP